MSFVEESCTRSLSRLVIATTATTTFWRIGVSVSSDNREVVIMISGPDTRVESGTWSEYCETCEWEAVGVTLLEGD